MFTRVFFACVFAANFFVNPAQAVRPVTLTKSEATQCLTEAKLNENFDYFFNEEGLLQPMAESADAVYKAIGECNKAKISKKTASTG